MNPPKITRPVEKPVEHTFPAWYQCSDGRLAILFAHNRGQFWNVHMREFVGMAITEHNKNEWERLPAGTVIEFTQP